MEHQKITNLLGNTPDKVPRFITKKWIEVHDQSEETYNTNKQIRFKICVILVMHILLLKKLLLLVLMKEKETKRIAKLF